MLFVVVMISVTKGGLEDLKRHAADKISNHRLVEKLLPLSAGGEDFESIEWRRVCVGDIIRVGDNSEFPADMILLLSSEEVEQEYRMQNMRAELLEFYHLI